MILSSLGLATFSPARKDLFLGAHGATSQGVTHPGIAPASNSLNFGVPTNPKPCPATVCFWELTKQLPRVVTHPGIAPASNSLNFGVPTNPKPVSSQEASYQMDARVVTHPGIAPASNSLNFGVPTNPKPVSSQKASHYFDARVVTHPGIAPASNSLNFGVPTNPKPVSSQKASHYFDARSSTEAEYRALANTAAHLAWIRQVLLDLRIFLPQPPTIHCDNLSTLALSSNPVYHSRIKHLDIDFHFVRERVQKKDLFVQYIPTEEQAPGCNRKSWKTQNLNFTDQLKEVTIELSNGFNGMELARSIFFNPFPISLTIPNQARMSPSKKSSAIPAPAE
ncbi:hypothetical protein L3X38_038726 [Prunus dulcis]|uniref:Uncharacterized protein n=1 Tax=Prunus dulcis TaxID=3755 RepID=A0AAD4V6W8_PRUDU|nr:hypothetical protein L3X38_038726 [Prunus dulcis]